MEYNNSDRSRKEDIAERTPLTPVGKGRRIKKRLNLSSFLAEDFGTLKDHFVNDIFFPWMRTSIYDIVTNGLAYFLFRDDGPPNARRPRGSKVAFTSYDRYYDRKPTGYSEPRINSPKGVYDYDDAEFDNFNEAEMALEALIDQIRRYGFTTVGSLYELAGITTNGSTVEKYGWTNLSRAKIKKSYDGWVIDLPRAMPIER